MSRVVATIVSVLVLADYIMFLLGGFPIERLVAFDITTIALYVIYTWSEVVSRKT